MMRFVTFGAKATAMLALGVLASGPSACQRRAHPGAATSASAPLGSASAAPVARASGPAPAHLSEPMRLPVGPVLPILPGEGVGPIRFGATVATIERHMQRACDVQGDGACRYFPEALEFVLRDDRLVEIRVHRRDRPGGKDAQGVAQVYGVFNGNIPEDRSARRPANVAFGMHAKGVAEGIGIANRVEQRDGSGPYGTREVHYHDGVILEYDQIPAAKVPILGGIRVIPRDR